MSITKASGWRTKDGKIFNSLEEANEHELYNKLMDLIYPREHNIIDGMYVLHTARVICKYRKEILEMLSCTSWVAGFYLLLNPEGWAKLIEGLLQ